MLTVESACKRERDQLTRLLASCSQLRVRAREREIGSQGSWPLAHAHSWERVRERERLAHKALGHSSERVRERECLTLFCCETLKYNTFCREMLKTGTCGRKNLDYAIWVKKWQICGESRLHSLRHSVANEYSLTRGKLHNCLSYLSIIFAKTFLLPYLITSFTNSCSLFQMEFFFDNGWPLFLNSW